MEIYKNKLREINERGKKIKLIINESVLDEIGGDIDFKLDYIKMIIEGDYSKRTVQQSIIIFKSIKKMELIYEKDAYNFDLQQSMILLKSFKKPSVTSLAAEKSLLEKYLLFAYKNNKVNLPTHPIFNIKMSDMEVFINSKSRENKYITYKEYLDLLDSCINDQDKALLILIWHGLLNRNMDLIRNLKTDNIDKNENKIIFTDYTDTETGEVKTIIKNLEEFEIKTLLEASNAPILVNLTDMSVINLNTESPYLFKFTLEGKIREGNLRDRFRKITIFLKKRDLKQKSLYVSGIYNEVRKLNLSNVDYYKKMSNYGICRNTATDVREVVGLKESL